jgi:hypothetical protein
VVFGWGWPVAPTLAAGNRDTVTALDGRPTLGLMPSERLLLSPEEACEALGLKDIRTFRRHVQPKLTPVIIGGLTRYEVAEITRWIGREMGRNRRGEKRGVRQKAA